MSLRALTRFLASTLVILVMWVSAFAEPFKLPLRTSPIPETTNRVPHIQLGVKADPERSALLLRETEKIPGVEIRETVISLPGAKGFWINDTVTITRPQNIVGGREFAHMHPDGSLHASLAPSLAVEAVKQGWAIFHPWSQQRNGWEGFVMIYTPTSQAELEVVIELVRRSYEFVTSKPGPDKD